MLANHFCDYNLADEAAEFYNFAILSLLDAGARRRRLFV